MRRNCGNEKEVLIKQTNIESETSEDVYTREFILLDSTVKNCLVMGKFL